MCSIFLKQDGEKCQSSERLKFYLINLEIWSGTGTVVSLRLALWRPAVKQSLRKVWSQIPSRIFPELDQVLMRHDFVVGRVSYFRLPKNVGSWVGALIRKISFLETNEEFWNNNYLTKPFHSMLSQCNKMITKRMP
jgi:hypothetical protein